MELILKGIAKQKRLPLLIDKNTDSNLYSYGFYLIQSNVMQLINLNDGVTLIFRDNAKKYNVTDRDASVSSLINFTALMLLSQINKSKYLLATGDNRTVHKIL